MTFFFSICNARNSYFSLFLSQTLLTFLSGQWRCGVTYVFPKGLGIPALHQCRRVFHISRTVDTSNSSLLYWVSSAIITTRKNRYCRTYSNQFFFSSLHSAFFPQVLLISVPVSAWRPAGTIWVLKLWRLSAAILTSATERKNPPKNLIIFSWILPFCIFRGVKLY